MRALIPYLPLALEGEWADWRAVGVVVAGIFAFFVSVYLLLWSNLGAKVGYLVLMVALSGWMIMFSLVWVIGVPGILPNTGPRTHEPRWVPFLEQSGQGTALQAALNEFPNGWDELRGDGRLYPGNIPSRGEFERIEATISDALARKSAVETGFGPTEKKDWRFRLAGPALTQAQERIPVADVRFFQRGTPLLVGVRILATDKHKGLTVFALRDKGAIFLDGLYIFLASILGFVVHLWLLARHESRARAAVATA